MKHHRRLIVCFITLFSLYSLVLQGQAQNSRAADINKITLENISSDSIFVKVIGNTYAIVKLNAGENNTINVKAGKYHILIRYGNHQNKYRYAIGATFIVNQNDATFSSINIKLNKKSWIEVCTSRKLTGSQVLNEVIRSEVYSSSTISRKEFDSVIDSYEIKDNSLETLKWKAVIKYLVINETELLKEPNGEKVETLLFGAKLKILVDSGAWVKVQNIESGNIGWLYKFLTTSMMVVEHLRKDKKIPVAVACLYYSSEDNKDHFPVVGRFEIRNSEEALLPGTLVFIDMSVNKSKGFLAHHDKIFILDQILKSSKPGLMYYFNENNKFEVIK